MSKMLKIDNRMMRRLWLDTNGLLSSSAEPLDVVEIIRKLGFVQLDTIQNVSRAHHHILWSRHQNYREPMLDELLKSQHHIFEHFTHDASIIHMDVYPMWRRRYKRFKAKFDASSYYDAERIEQWQDILINSITAEGALSTKDFGSKPNLKNKVWSRPPHKYVLDYLWYIGILATSHRINFRKFYDLSERVIPKKSQKIDISEADQVSWLCHAALERLAVGSPKEIKEFWDAKDIKEVKCWIDESNDHVLPVKWETDHGEWVTSYALQGVQERIDNLSTPSTSPSARIRIINPFDPAVRNRERLKTIFGFDYKLEIFVPAAKRKWGYYIYLLLEGDRFIGRIEAKADRKTGHLNITNLWPEKGVKWGKSRQKKLETELSKFAQLAGLDTVNWRQ